MPVVYCHCKIASCESGQCKCFTAKLKCSLRCHQGKGSTCKNMEISPNNPISTEPPPLISHTTKNASSAIFPKFGGCMKSEGHQYIFQNTCPVDTWLAVLKVLLLKGVINSDNAMYPEHVKELLTLVDNSKFDEAKLHIGCFKKLVLQSNVIHKAIFTAADASCRTITM